MALGFAGRSPGQGAGEPLAVKRKPPVPTFAQAAEEFLDRRKATWKGSKYESDWRNSLTTYTYPKIGSLRIDAIETA